MKRWTGAGALFAAMTLAGAPCEAQGQSWQTMTVSRQDQGEASLDVRISYAVGHLSVRPADGGLLYRMRLRYDEDHFEPRAEFDGRDLYLGVEGLEHGGDFEDHGDFGAHTGGEMELALATGVPMDLDLEFGAVEADFDLGGLSMTSLDLETGASSSRLDVSSPNPIAMDHAVFEVGAAEFTARRLGNLNARRISVSAGVGEVTLDFTGAWRRDAEVDVEMGLGSLTLRFPEGLGVRLRKETFLTALDAQGLVKHGDEYLSPNWESAERRITVDVEAAFGSIEIDWVR